MKFFCVNLVSRPDRKLSAINEFKKLQIPKVIFPKFEKHPKGGRIGCIDSHMKIWRNRNIKDDELVVIFEDDFQYALDDPKIFHRLLREANEILNNEMGEIITFCGSTITRHCKISRNFTKGINTSTLCYCSKGKILKNLYRRLYSTKYLHVDIMLFFNTNTIACNKILFTQQTEDSDNPWVMNKYLDQFLRKYMTSFNKNEEDLTLWNRLCNKLVKRCVMYQVLKHQEM